VQNAGGSDYASAVGAMSGALGGLSLDIADTIKKCARGVLEVRGPRRFWEERPYRI
jgi:hypothetical protein